jgi:hypothetical protein
MLKRSKVTAGLQQLLRLAKGDPEQEGQIRRAVIEYIPPGMGIVLWLLPGCISDREPESGRF